MQKITTFLMFEGKAEEAMKLYVSLVPDSQIETIDRYGQEGPGRAGTVRRAVFRLGHQRFMCIDSPIAHGFTFTPAVSLYAACQSPAEVDRLYERLAEGGQVLMPLDAYPFCKRYAWVNDRFGVSWQIALAD